MLSGERAKQTTAAITQFYRTPGSAGYHAATNLVTELLRQAGLDDLQVTTYPIDGETSVLGDRMPLAWEPYGARVRLVNPVQEELVNFESAPTCLCVWSQPTPPGGMMAEVTDVGTGESEADWAGKDLTGQVAFIHSTDRREAWRYAAAEALRRGAKGVLTDYFLYPVPPFRTREQVPDAVQFLRLPNTQGEFDAWGCSLSLRAGQRLRELLKLGPVTMHADIRCRSFKGYGQNVVATITGRELPQELVILMAHTTGPRPGANCAAGSALLVEIARVLQDLIRTGQIRRPRRTIQFMVVAEGLGTEVYIDGHRDALSRIKCAICLDSVGNHQDRLKSTLMFCRHPDSSPSFINDYFEGVMARVPKDARWVGRDDAGISPVVFTSEPYTPWSDNNRWASFGIPSPLVMSSPSIYFHTQFLTAETADPQVFRRAGVSTAVALYEIADAGLAEALAIAAEVAARSRFRLETISNHAVWRLLTAGQVPSGDGGPEAIAEWALRELRYCSERDAKAIASTASLIPGRPPAEAEQRIGAHVANLKQLAEEKAQHVEEVLAALLGERKKRSRPLEGRAVMLVPRKVAPGFTPGIGIFSYPKQAEIAKPMLAQDPKFVFYALRVMNDEVWNLIDGRRSVADIAEAICMEFGFELDPALFLPLVEGLVREGLVTWVPREDRAQ